MKTYLVWLFALALATSSLISCQEQKSPTAAFSASPNSGEPPLEVTFDASASKDKDGEIVSYVWLFHTGQTKTGAITEFTFDSPGVYVVKLTVTDNDGLSSSVIEEIRVSVGDGETQTIGPTGGTLNFQDGLTMTFPSGAVLNETTVTSRPLRLEDVSELYEGSLTSLGEGKILGGFIAEASVQQFDVPVVVSVPVTPRTDTHAKLAHARLANDGENLKLDQVDLSIDSDDDEINIALSSFSPNIIFEYALYLKLTSPDSAIKLQFFLNVDREYRRGNRGDEGFLDLEGGIQQALTYLRSKIGTSYDGANLFCGFDLTIVSKVISIDPPSDDIVQDDTVSTGIDACGDDFSKLYESEPWINATLQDRSYTNTIVTPNTEKQEIYDLSVVAYIRPHNVRFMIDSLKLGLDIHDSRFVGEEWITSNIDHSKAPIDNPQGSPTPMPKSLSESVSGSYRGGVGYGRIELEVLNGGWSFRLTSQGFGGKEDGRYNYLGEWSVNPLTTLYAPLEVIIPVNIDNPEAKDVTVRVNHAGRCDGPDELDGPWQQQAGDLVAITGNDPDDPTITPIYGAFGDDAPSHNGSQDYVYSDEEIQFVLFFMMHHIRATDFFAERLKYRIECSSEITVDVLVTVPP
jgi:PKD repeat protein